VIVAAFAASLCGFVLFWLAGEVGIIVTQTVFGLAWASLGYFLRR
jgi:hypothetical protein